MTFEDIMADKEKRSLFAKVVLLFEKSDGFDWYDSQFLRQFEAAKEILGQTNPGRVKEFVDAIEPLRTDPAFKFQHKRGLIDPNRFRTANETVTSVADERLEHHESDEFGRTIIHNMDEFDDLHQSLTDWVSDCAGEAVRPTYTFLSLYQNQGRLTPHIDAPKAKYTLDICLSQNVEWPIFVSDVVDWPTADGKSSSGKSDEQNFHEVVLQPNDAVLFSGSAQWHYRDPMPDQQNGFCNLLFLHYAPVGTEESADPKRWAEYFGLEELNVVHAACKWRLEKTKELKALNRAAVLKASDG